MAHTNTIISGIECCVKHKCMLCPYYTRNICHCDELLDDILEKLKTKENKVLTLNEIKTCDFAYIEYASAVLLDPPIEPCAVLNTDDDYVYVCLKDGGMFTYKQSFKLNTYNVTWRLWKQKPSFRETRAAAWSNEVKHDG